MEEVAVLPVPKRMRMASSPWICRTCPEDMLPSHAVPSARVPVRLPAAVLVTSVPDAWRREETIDPAARPRLRPYAVTVKDAVPIGPSVYVCAMA